jgi:hypothetical protein
VYEPTLLKASDLSRMDFAFYTLHGIVSRIYMAAVIALTAIG